MYAQLVASVLGLLTTTCDALVLTRRKEMEYIWKQPLQVTFVQCLFILSRYLALSIHIVHIVFASLLLLRLPGHQQPTHDDCVTWVIFQIISCNTMLFILELILSTRVFALYEQSLKIGMFLLTMLIGRMAVSISIASVQVSSRVTFSEQHCQTTRSIADPNQDHMLAFIIGELAIHSIIHGLALKRTVWDLRRYTLSRPPLVSVLNRDGLRVFVAVFVGMAAFGVSTEAKVGISGREATLFIYPLFISLVSTLGCRTILNLQTLDITGTSSSKDNTVLDLTIIDSSSTWDTATRSELDTESRPTDEII